MTPTNRKALEARVKSLARKESKWAKRNEREQKLLQYVSQGLTYKAMGLLLGISAGAVCHKLQRMKKGGVRVPDYRVVRGLIKARESEFMNSPALKGELRDWAEWGLRLGVSPEVIRLALNR